MKTANSAGEIQIERKWNQGRNRYCGNVVTALIQARGTQEGKLINIKEGSGVTKRMKMCQRE